MKKETLPKYWILLLIVIIILGTFFTFYQLERKSLWVDEIYSSSHAHKPLKEIIFYNPTKENMWNNSHPVLHYVLMHFSFNIGESDFFARLPSALFGTAFIILMFFAGRSLFSGKCGVFAAFLSSISIYFLAHVQEARMYSAFAFFSLLSLLCFYNIIFKKQASFYFWIGFILATVGNLYTHSFATMVVAIQIISAALILISRILFKDNRSKNTRILLFFIISLLLCALLSAPEFLKNNNLIRQHIGGNSISRFVRTSPVFILTIFRDFSSQDSSLTLLYFAGFAIGLITCLIKQPSGFLFLLIWLSFPFFVIFTLNANHFFRAKYIFFVFPVYLLLTAYGIVSFFNALSGICSKYFSRIKKRDYTFFFILVLMVIMIKEEAPHFRKFYSQEKNNWKAAAAYLAENARENDVIIANETAFSCIEYYLRNNSLKNNLVFKPEKIVENSPDSFWFVTHHSPPTIFPPEYILTEKNRFKSEHVTVYRFVKRGELFLEECSLSATSATPKKQLNISFSVKNLDTRFYQPAAFWVTAQNETSHITQSLHNEIIQLCPGETRKISCPISAPSLPGNYEIIVSLSRPPYVFFPWHPDCFFRNTTLKKDTTSPSCLVQSIDEKDSCIGYVIWGPYHSFPPGDYTALFFLKSTSHVSQNKDLAIIDVAADAGETILSKKTINSSAFAENTFIAFSLSFSLKDRTKIEFRINRLAFAEILFGGVAITQKMPEWSMHTRRKIQKKSIPVEILDAQ